MSYIPAYPQAPYDAVMPAMAQDVLLWIVGISFLFCCAYALRECKRTQSGLPLLFLVAGLATVALDPFVAHLGHAIHPPVGQKFTLFTALDRDYPLHILLLYGVYYGPVYLAMFSRIRDNSFSYSFLWQVFGGFCVAAYVMEIWPLHLGLWAYYDHQALQVWDGGMPLFHTVLNGTSLFVPLALIKLCYPLLKGWKQIFVVALSPVGAIMGHVGCGFPFYLATNSAASHLLINLAGLLSIGFALGCIHVCNRLLVADTSQLLAPLDRRAC